MQVFLVAGHTQAEAARKAKLFPRSHLILQSVFMRYTVFTLATHILAFYELHMSQEQIKYKLIIPSNHLIFLLGFLSQ